MKRILIVSLWCLMVVACASQQVIATPILINTPRPPATITALPSATSTPGLTTTPLPASIVENAFRSGMSPEEIVSFYLEIRSDLENKNVDALADKVYFPLNECGRNKGDNIETKDEFVQRFDEIFTDEVVSDYLNANLEDTIIDVYGFYIGGISLGATCTDKTCNTIQTWIFGVNRYCSYRRTPPMGDDQVATEEARTDYPGENFAIGIYRMESYEDHGGLIPEEEISKLKSVEVRIEKDNFSTDSNCNFGCSCPIPEYEFNKPFYGEGRALWFGIPAIGELIVICDGTPSVYYDVLADNKIGYYFYGYYITLVHQ